MNNVPEYPFDEARVWKVFAGAGCGKTTIIKQCINSLLAAGILPTQIMYVLFNKKPVLSFRKSFSNLNDKDMRWWGTHHSIMLRLQGFKRKNILNLSKWGAAHGFDLPDEYELNQQKMNNLGWNSVFSSLSRKIYTEDKTRTGEEMHLLEALQQTEVSDQQYAHVRYLERGINLDLFPPAVKYVFVDETQDNGSLQFRWFNSILKRQDVLGLMLVGDDKQSVNVFKGADARLFLHFPADREVNLDTTFRLSSELLKETNRIIEPVRERSALTLTSSNEHKTSLFDLPDISYCLPDIHDALKKQQSVMVLVRNRVYISLVERALEDDGIPTVKDFHKHVKRVVSGLLKIRSMGAITEETLSAILPRDVNKLQEGELIPTSYWEPDAVRRLRAGDFLDDPAMYEAYEVLRLGGELPISSLRALGFNSQFEIDLVAWNLPLSRWNLAPVHLSSFKLAIKIFGWDYPMVRIDTIHAVKGEEADLVVLIKNITQRTKTAELDDEDAERRVWFVGATRAKEKLIYTRVNKTSEITSLI